MPAVLNMDLLPFCMDCTVVYMHVESIGLGRPTVAK